jgi:hypothetical protein
MLRQLVNFIYDALPLWLRPRYILEARARSSQWKKVRAQHLLKESACVACGRVHDLEVHHIIPVSVDPTLELDENNLITLCASPCHRVFGHFLSYHCYNKHVREMAEYYRWRLKNRICNQYPPKA